MKKFFLELIFVLLFSLDIIIFRLFIFNATTDGQKFVTGVSAMGLLVALIVFMFSYKNKED